MKLIRGLYNFPESLSQSVVTMGNFDGVHLGHQELIAKLKQLSKQLNLPSVLVTFEPQPLEFFHRGEKVPRLMRLREKYYALEKYDIDYLWVLRFNAELAAQSPQDFVEKILHKKLGMQACVVGDDFRFGAKRAGDFALLKKLGEQYGYVAKQIPTKIIQTERVSSTRVREALAAADLEVVQQLLDRPYSLCGKVRYGNQRGRDLGFPTANISLHRALVPVSGVFAVRAKRLGKQDYYGVANVGVRPTFDGTRVVLEVHLFDFNQEIYGQHIEVEFLHKLRDEERYDSLEALVRQIKQDVRDARLYFAELPCEK